MQRAQDEEILSKAVSDSSVIITLDADFHALVAVRGMRKPSVVRLRQEGCDANRVVAILGGVLIQHRTRLANGCLISVTDRRASFRMLPIVRPV